MQYKSYSLTGAGAAQLSQSVKDRFGTNSLPKSGLEMHAFQARLEKFFFVFLLSNLDFHLLTSVTNKNSLYIFYPFLYMLSYVTIYRM